MENVNDIREILIELHRLGIYLSLDDFGTGYSSLGYLKHIPVNELKIDRTFIQGIAENKDDVAIVKAIIALGRTLGKQVIAEGVETIKQAQILEKLHCNHIQGYVIAKPAAANHFRSWMQSL